MAIRIYLVDDHQMFLDGLMLALKEQPDMEVVGESLNADTAIQGIQKNAPDLVITDVTLGESNGIELARQVLAAKLCPRVLVLTAFPDPEFVRGAMEAGVAGYLLKGCSSEEVIRAVRAIMDGKLYICPEVATVIVTDYRKYHEEKPAKDKSRLSEREKEVIKMIAEGLRTKDIASRLELSVKTVETHRARIMAKLECGSVADLVRYALKQGVLSH